MQLSPAQIEAVNSDAPLILSVASPGSGKTRVLTERIKRLSTTCSPHQIIAITFTNNAAREIQKRLGFKIGYAGTLHGFVLRLLQEFGHIVGFSGKITVLDETATDEILESTIKENSYKGSKSDLLEAIANYPHSGLITKAALAAYDFHRRLLAGNMVTFDSILTHGRTLVPLIQDQLKGRWLHLMVDEYQDATGPDVSIYEPLPVPNKFYVGDPSQSIYKFRGGSIDHIQRMANYPNVTLLPLSTNYRSDISICAAAQQLIEHNPNRIASAIVPHSQQIGETGFIECDDAQSEINMIYRHITVGGLNPEECAVLIRSNALVDKYATALKALGLPVAHRRHNTKPKDWPTAMLVLALLTNPDNDVLVSMWLKKKMTPEQFHAVEMEAASKFTSINAMLTGTEFQIPYYSLAIDVPNRLARGTLSAESVEKIAAIVDTLPPDATLADLVLAIGEEDKVEHEVGTGLTVTTIHASKGREWKTVFMPCMEQGTLPSQSKNADIEEDRRLAYVGITRAEHRLVISYCAEREPDYGFGKPVARQPSQFIREMGL